MKEKLRKYYRKYHSIKKLNEFIYKINSKKVDAIFIHIPKTAGISIQKALKSPIQAHMIAWHVYKRVDKNIWDNTLKFAVVRNPYDRMLSDYLYRVKTNQHNLQEKKLTFKEWLNKTFVECDPFYHDKRYNWINQVDWISKPNGEILINEILFFENLSTDLKKINNKYNLDINLSLNNSTNRKKHYSEFYDEESKAIVEKWYKKDLDYFKYTF
ncbi:sulfotransferase family 2 domain-containing protein [Flammeovirga kamogawensis]|uniref:Sulfotransferase family protein n=1 Tax=Flammeovirga kamogawensis TaxID=373891 RepID=A0ABX8GXZ4_9BACT|nr:sulfotransferase family 2 domain-containing protein [Flammeovirga kamogawensis]MBB6458895.1 hypothetical protein [Flammeovirga kamogawensis]QWG08476.1 sulfotransferase family protein [Flammeovirga kamogawensis]TRX66771.1 hypothetical protein EO216_00990 [Flammeovirga kamogawensis]